MLSQLKVVPAISLIMLLGAFNHPSHADVGTVIPATPALVTPEGRTVNRCSLDPACSSNPLAPFFANVSMAPADGAAMNGIERLEVIGNGMANVELLPASGYAPKLGIFNISADQTRAWLDLDTTTLPNGPLGVRISAFNVPAGQSGASEIIAMPARTWDINNAPSPPAAFSAAVTSAPADGAAVIGITRLEVRGSGIANVELLPASGFTPKLAVFNVSADRTSAWLDFDSRSLPDGIRDVRISAFNATEGQPGAAEIIAMPARRWDFKNGLSFSATVTIAPINGEFVSGVTRLEVRGSGMRNVELLPASGFTPKFGTFNVSNDRTFAWLDFDTRTLGIGPANFRISAFNVPAGQPGAVEIIAMPAREWNLRHLPLIPPPAGGFHVDSLVAPDDRATISGIVRLEVRGSGIENVELLPPDGFGTKYGTFTVEPDKTLAHLDFDTTAMPDIRLQAMRISAFNRPAGSPDASEIIVKPARFWYVSNRADHSQCMRYDAINVTPDLRPAQFDGSLGNTFHCEPAFWPNNVKPQDCECFEYRE